MDRRTNRRTGGTLNCSLLQCSGCRVIYAELANCPLLAWAPPSRLFFLFLTLQLLSLCFRENDQQPLKPGSLGSILNSTTTKDSLGPTRKRRTWDLSWLATTTCMYIGKLHTSTIVYKHLHLLFVTVHEFNSRDTCSFCIKSHSSRYCWHPHIKRGALFNLTRSE